MQAIAQSISGAATPPAAPAAQPEAEAQGAAEGASTPVLADLIAAGLVSHEMIGDPDRLGGEAAALKALCALISGPVWRIEAYHYAFRVDARDLGGRLGGMNAGDWTAALAAAMTEALGPDAVWINPTDLLTETGAALDQPLLLLRAHAAAVGDGIAAAGPEVSAVISARYAAEVARLSTGTRSPLAAHVSVLGTRIDALAERVAALRSPAPALTPEAMAESLAARVSQSMAHTFDQMLEAALEDALAEALRPVVARLDAQAEALAAQTARLDALAARIDSGVAEIAAQAAAPAAFQETIGVTLAELLSRAEYRLEAGLRLATRPQ